MLGWTIQNRRTMSALIITLLITSVYLYVFPSPTLAYITVVMLHAGLGVITVVFLFPKLRLIFSIEGARQHPDWLVITLGAGVGIVLLFLGTIRPHWIWMYAHIALSFAGVGLLAVRWTECESRDRFNSRTAGATFRVLGFLGLAIALSVGGWKIREAHWFSAPPISNPPSPPFSMNQEGDGQTGPFFPSSAQTTDGKYIPAQYFMQSDSCERCHHDIYRQWSSSAHHFSSFNNQWYRKSIEYMQDVVGIKPSKWCAGCHDPALLFSGMFDAPIQQIINRPEAHAGLGCTVCHSIVQVKSSMGQGDFTLAYPKLHELIASNNPVVHWLHDYVTHLNPEPHRRLFLKPFMRQQTAELCSSCHKVHLDLPVNQYRWVRGFNEYDNWQASGVSGQGARSFYYPPQPLHCANCHMPTVESTDMGAINGKIHSHTFPGANTALPVANNDSVQLALTENFLKNAVTVDIFAISPMTQGGTSDDASADAMPAELSTTFAVGEEAETPDPLARSTKNLSQRLSAPLNRVAPVVRRGDTLLVDVVVRSRKVGHFFPGGTVDANEAWLEFKVTDDHDRLIFWSGQVEDDGRGPVEKGAHFYRALQIDAHGNPINKRNTWASRAVVYVRLIPPGAADTVHYRLKIPPETGDKIKLQAWLHYRKFAWWYTQFSYAGVLDPSMSQPQSTFQYQYDDRHFVFSGDTSHVSGKLKHIPDLPSVVISQNEVSLAVRPANVPVMPAQVDLRREDWTRWNDYGIGLFLQGDLKGARRAFEQITRIDTANPNGWVNLGRVEVKEGDMERARQVLQKALQLKPNLASAHYFFAHVLRTEGHYEEAVCHLQTVLAQYPLDRVARNDLGRLFFLLRKFDNAVAEFKRVLMIDPEDLQAHYNLMLSYQGLGEIEKAQQEETLYRRFKADETSQALTGDYLKLHPEDNNERQAIHEHGSMSWNHAVAIRN